MNQLLGFGLTLITLPLYDVIDSYTIIVLFVIPPSLCLFALYRLLPETKDRDIQDIITQLRRAVGHSSGENNVRVEYEVRETK